MSQLITPDIIDTVLDELKEMGYKIEPPKLDGPTSVDWADDVDNEPATIVFQASRSITDESVVEELQRLHDTYGYRLAEKLRNL
ncbi:hypothetical protein DYU11_11705 [Fibrisoma montanum]|uniref:Uncharacterized protein n=1 Tax=Fibrisoma montanum TaxID=2305895 RepID=A0A418MBB9_9BACT|nr:hypothetical protein [Fibrisoma montanum]RIV23640.1 hypothetical protein DYU11_11705 [Fibrisoma montanum]